MGRLGLVAVRVEAPALAPHPGPTFVAAGLPIELSQIPWSFVMAFASLGLIFLLFKRNGGVFEDLAFSGREVTLLALGSIAGWAVNIPVLIAGGTYVAVNVGGTIVPMILIGWWVRTRKLRPVATLVGTALVAFVSWRIVEFQPAAGIVTRYPLFFLPVVVALVFALLVSIRKPVTGVPIAYASGTMGALIGADLMHLAEIRAHFGSASDNAIISIGGAGVFDMVFLAGTFAMALNLVIITILGVRGKRPTVEAEAPYPARRPFRLRDSRRAWDSYLKLEDPNPLERSIAGLALSDVALREGDFARSVRMSWLAVDSLLRTAPVQEYLGAAGPDEPVRPAALALREDVARLSTAYRTARGGAANLRAAGEANAAARHILAALVPRTPLPARLEGVA